MLGERVKSNKENLGFKCIHRFRGFSILIYNWNQQFSSWDILNGFKWGESWNFVFIDDNCSGIIFIFFVIYHRNYLIYLFKVGKFLAMYIIEEWLVKMIEFAKMAELNCLIREKTISTFTADWKPLMHFLCKTGKKRTYNLQFLLLDGIDYRKRESHSVTLEKEVKLQLYLQPL